MRDVKKLTMRSRSMWWIDGVAEIVTGTILVISSVIALLLSYQSLSRTYRFILVAIQIGIIFAGPYIIRWLKAKYIQPVTGYFKPTRKSSQGKIIYMLVVAVLGILFAFAVISGSIWWVPVSLISLFVLVFTGIYWNVRRLVYLGIIEAILPPIISLLYRGDHRTVVSLILMGIVILVSGVVTYIRFKKEFNVDG